MKIFTISFIVLVVMSIVCAQDKDKVKTVTIFKDKTMYLDSLTLERKEKFKCNNIKIGNDSSVQFIATEEAVPLIIIIPKADSLFSNYNVLPDTNYFVNIINGITFLSIYLDKTYLQSQNLFIKYHDPEQKKDKYYYPYTVYIIKKHLMAEGHSSPEIIVDP